MKIYGSLLALSCVLQGASAFHLQAPKSSATKLHSSAYDTMSATYGSATGAGGQTSAAAIGASAADMQFAQGLATLEETRIQGGALRTWSFQNAERLLVSMTSDDRTLTTLTHEGRLLHAKIDLCQGPDNKPLIMEVKSGKGKYRPFRAIIETPGSHGSLFIRNIGNLEFPINASVGPSVDEDLAGTGARVVSKDIYDMSKEEVVQGGAVTVFPLEFDVTHAKVILKTDGRPLNCKVELIQGPNSIKHNIDIYTEDGMERPFFAIIETPGAGNVIRIVNTGNVDFPLSVCVEPFLAFAE